MRMHYGFNVVTGEWVFGSFMSSPSAVQEFCAQHNLQGFEPQSVDVIDAYFRPFKTAIDNRNNVTQVNYQAEQEQAAKNQVVGLSATSIIPPPPTDPNLEAAKAKMEAARDASVAKGTDIAGIAKEAAAQEQVEQAGKKVEELQKAGTLAQDPGPVEEAKPVNAPSDSQPSPTPPVKETLQEKMARLKAEKK
jgi:hypothetical protein